MFNFYSVEVVQRIGYDSFTPDNGVLIAKNKDREGNTCGYNCFTWVVDARPADIRMADYVRPDGTRAMRTIADYRQLNDALFHAGLRSGTEYEWEDSANRLHFYVIDVHRSAAGILAYSVAVRSLDGAGPHARGVAAGATASQVIAGSAGNWNVTLRNTGRTESLPAGLHPQEAPVHFDSDVYRLAVSIDGDGWSAALQNALTAVRSGRTETIAVRISKTANAARTANVTFTAISESDPGKRAVVSASLSAR